MQNNCDDSTVYLVYDCYDAAVYLTRPPRPPLSRVQLLFKRYPTNFLVNLFGHWEEVGQQGQSIPVSGLVYYLSPPTGFMEVVQVPPP